MKICYIGSAKSIHLQRWIKWFVDNGHEIHLITSSLAEIDGIIIHPIGDEREGSLFNFIKKMVQTKKLLRKIDPDILHAHYAFGPGTFGAFSGFHPFILSPWGGDISIDSKSFIKRFFMKYALRRADIISAVDGSIKKRLIELKCDPKRLVSLRIASVDTRCFHPSKRTESLRKSLGDNNDFLVLNARPLSPVYHVELLVRAVPLVVKKIPSVKFIIVSFNQNETYRNQIFKLIKELNIEDKIVIVDAISHSEMPEYLASVDLYVDTLVSFRHAESGEKCPGIGTTALEAMSCGTPTFISNENLDSHCPYVPYHPMDYEDLARKIVELLQNEELRNRVKERSLDYARQVGDENKIMANWEKIYYELIEKDAIKR